MHSNTLTKLTNTNQAFTLNYFATSHVSSLAQVLNLLKSLSPDRLIWSVGEILVQDRVNYSRRDLCHLARAKLEGLVSGRTCIDISDMSNA